MFIVCTGKTVLRLFPKVARLKRDYSYVTEIIAHLRDRNYLADGYISRFG
jgi:hypothetical protein